MALTAPQIFEHVGRMLNYAYGNLLTEANRPIFMQVSRWLIKAGGRYVQNGTTGTQADRLEAMLAARRQIFQALSGMDPADGAAGQHFFEQHFLTEVEGQDP